jgi:archaellum component FlaC
MTNTQLLISVGLPMILVLVGILLGQKNVGEINGRLDRMDQRMDKIESRLDRIDADLRQFFSITGRLEGRMDSLEKR